MKKQKMVLCMVVCVVMIVSMIASCSKPAGGESSATPSNTEEADTFNFEMGADAVGSRANSDATGENDNAGNNEGVKKDGDTANKNNNASPNKDNKQPGIVVKKDTDVDTSVDDSAPKYFPDRKNIKGEIVLFIPYETNTEVYKKLFSDFEKKYPKATLKIVNSPWASQEIKLAQQFNSQNAPDYIYCTIGNFPSRAIKKYAQPIDKYITVYPQLVSKYMMESVTSWEGKKYAVIGIRNPSLMYYNTKMIKNAGLTTPFDLWKKNDWTWAKMKEYSRELTDTSKKTYGFGTDWEQNFLASAGTDIVKFDSKGKPSLNIDDTKFKEALLYYYDGVNKDKIFSPTRWDNRKDFIDGKIAMFGGIYGDYETMLNAGFKDFGIVPFPKYDDANGYVGIAEGDGWCVGSGCKNPEGGMAFGEFSRNFFAERSEKQSVKAPYNKEQIDMVKSIVNRISFINNYGMYDSFSQAFGNFMRKNGDFNALLEENRPTWNKNIRDVLAGI